MQAMDRLITEQWQDVYTFFSISRTVPFRLQNKGSDWITIQAVTTQPSPLSNEGIVLRTFDSLIITPMVSPLVIAELVLLGWRNAEDERQPKNSEELI